MYEKSEYYCDLCNQKIHAPKLNLFKFGIFSGKHIIVRCDQSMPDHKKDLCKNCIKLIKDFQI